MQMVRLIQQWRRNGRSLLARELNSAGVRPKSGGQQWYASTVRRILSNSLHQAEAEAA